MAGEVGAWSVPVLRAPRNSMGMSEVASVCCTADEPASTENMRRRHCR
jgi:hypothetical protein